MTRSRTCSRCRTTLDLSAFPHGRRWARSSNRARVCRACSRASRRRAERVRLQATTCPKGCTCVDCLYPAQDHAWARVTHHVHTEAVA